jgi:hypothetical protein
MKAMKRAKYILGFLFVSLSLALTSCDEDEIVRTSTHTDASGLVVGTYTGTLSYEDSVSFDNVSVILTKIENDSFQAVTLNIQSPEFNFGDAAGMDLTAEVNVAKAADGFVISSGLSKTSKLTGRLNDNDLSLILPLLVFKKQPMFVNSTFTLIWEFNGTKK